MNRISLSNYEELGEQTDYIDDTLRNIYEDQTFCYKMYFLAYCHIGIIQLQWLFLKYPWNLYTNAVDGEGNDGILLAAAENRGLDTVELLKQKGFAIDGVNHYTRTALMKAALGGHFKTIRYLIDNGKGC